MINIYIYVYIYRYIRTHIISYINVLYIYTANTELPRIIPQGVIRNSTLDVPLEPEVLPSGRSKLNQQKNRKGTEGDTVDTRNPANHLGYTKPL